MTKRYPSNFQGLIFLLTFFWTNLALAQIPTIKYNGPQTFKASSPITPQIPNSTGVASQGYNSGIKFISLQHTPVGVAVDPAGNVFVLDGVSNVVYEIPVGGGSTSTITLGSGFSGPVGIAVDAADNIYVADSGHGSVKKIPVGNKPPVTLASGFIYPSAVAVDAAGNVYVTGPQDPLTKIPVGGGSTVVMNINLAGEGVAVDAQGNVYVADSSLEAVEEVLAKDGSTVNVTNGPSISPWSIAIDGGGNIFFSDDDSSPDNIHEIPAGGGAPFIVVPRYDTGDLAIDGAGNIYTTPDLYDVYKRSPNGGYYISPALPSGLIFNNATGVISGTPTAASSATNYTITAYNSKGSAKAIVNITVTASGIPLSFSPISPVTYGAADFTPGATSGAAITYTSSNTAVATIIANKIHITGAGMSTITATSGSSHLNQSLTVNPATLAINADNKSITYGSAIPQLTVSYIGFVNGDGVINLVNQPTVTTTATQLSSAGSYPITASSASGANYTIKYATGTLIINPATLAITADNKSITYGSAIPQLTVSYTGFVNSDGVASLASQPIVTTTATQLSSTGSYPITASSASGVNYTIKYTPGTLIINPAPSPTITSISASTAVDGSIVNITGTNFLGATAVKFGGTASSSFTVNSATSITAIVGSGSTGSVTVTTASGLGAFAGFYFIPALSITANGPTTILGDGNGVVLTAAPGNGFSYQWMNNGIAINGATNATYNAMQSGNYTVLISLNGLSQISKPIVVTSVFALPDDNFKLKMTGLTCEGNNDGTLAISATNSLKYTATITGNNLNSSYPFTGSLTVDSLAAGSYSVCITVAGQPNYNNCFTIVVTQPQPLSVYSVVNSSANTVTLSLNGGNEYLVNLNGATYKTTKNIMTLSLQTGNNLLKITTDRFCQGSVEKLINASGNILVYPVPFQNTLYVNIGNTNIENVLVKIYDTGAGKIVYAHQYANQSGVMELDLSTLQGGVYALHLILNNDDHIYKILK